MKVIDPRLLQVSALLNEIMGEQNRGNNHEQVLSVLSDSLETFDTDNDEYRRTADALSFALGTTVEQPSEDGWREVRAHIHSQCVEFESAVYDLHRAIWLGSITEITTARKRVSEIKESMLPSSVRG